MGVVKTQFEAVLFTGVGQLFDDISFGICVFGHIVITHLAVPQGKSIVMLGGDAHILHPGLFGQQYPLFRINLVPVETVQQGEILIPVDPVPVVDPFCIIVIVSQLLSLPASFRTTVNTPVYKHPKAGIGKPLGTLVCVLLAMPMDGKDYQNGGQNGDFL